MSDPRKDIPLFHRVLVEVDPEIAAFEGISKGGIILPPPQDGIGSNSEDLREATVLAVGQGEMVYGTTTMRPCAVRPGQRVRVHANEVLPVKRPHDPTDPIVGYVFDTQILGIVTAEEQRPETTTKRSFIGSEDMIDTLGGR